MLSVNIGGGRGNQKEDMREREGGETRDKVGGGEQEGDRGGAEVERASAGHGPD